MEFKKLTKEQILISIDRLTRFKQTDIKYNRVFTDILVNNLLFPKFKKNEILNLPKKELKNYAQEIINKSVEEFIPEVNCDGLINFEIFKYESKVFKVDEDTSILLDNEINYKAIVSLIDDNAPKNLQWLKKLSSSKNIIKSREELELLFPIEKIVIVEGATEDLLLPKFAQLCNYDFNKYGIYIYPAGGKNQVVKLYYQLVETTNLPIFVLLDKDATNNFEEIKPKLRNSDLVHLIKSGEFEDLLTENLFIKALNYELNNISILEQEILNTPEATRVKILEEIFRTRGMHEFKKVEFAQAVKLNITSDDDVSEEIKEIILKIKNL